ncbi:hypothetical protein J6524_09860 [Bradyrhizobium sp. WSM 1738]|nr:hypothetical protein [Bradyrhizobium hereditatis]
MRRCTRETCFVPDTGCGLGHTDLTKCPAWTANEEASSALSELTDEVLLPWSGSALGLADLGFLAGRARPMVVGIAGSQNAGKTTLLGAWYLLLGRGAVKLPNKVFAGSYSLAGWEAVAGSLRWDPGYPASFPPHTTSRSGRAPGLLHLSFRDERRRRLTDYLMTDAPGEWFQKWSINRDSPGGLGARWVAERADILLIVADRDALSGEGMGSARGAFQVLAGRMAAERKGRPVALVWTKADVRVSPDVEKAVRQAVFGPMPDAREFSVSVLSRSGSEPGVGVGLIELLDWILSLHRGSVDLPKPSVANSDPLFIYGGAS